jgi:hypothetical protein
MTFIVWYLDKSSVVKRQYFSSFSKFLYDEFPDFMRDKVKDVCVLGAKTSVIDMELVLSRYPNLKNLTLDYVCFDDILFENCDTTLFDKIRQVRMGCYMLPPEEEILNDDDLCAKSIANIFCKFKNLTIFKFNGDPCSEICEEIQLGFVTQHSLQKFSFTSYEDDFSDDFIPFLIHSKKLNKVKLWGRSYKHDNLKVVADILDHIQDRNSKHNISLFDLLKLKLE